MMEGKILISKNASQWNNVLSTYFQLFDDIYFTSAYTQLYAGEGQIECFVFTDQDKCLFFPYIKRPLPESLGMGGYDIETAYGYSGPLANANDQEFLTQAWKSFVEYGVSEGIIAGFVRFNSLLNNQCWAWPGDFGQIIKGNRVVVLTLDKTREEIWQGYSPNTRNKVRQAIKKGVHVKRVNVQNDFHCFQKLYHQTMDQVKASEDYYFDEQYFTNLCTTLSEHCRLYFAYHEQTIIGAALTFHRHGRVYYHLSANIKEYRQYQPASLLRHEVILDSLKRNEHIILFGGGTTADPDDSLLKFKQGFSMESADFYFGKLLLNSEAYDKICDSWEAFHSDKAKRFGHYFLKYRN